MQLPERIYHLAEAANWPSIRRRGLLCASDLLGLAGVTGAGRERLERAQRREHSVLPGGAEIRDQRPMPPEALAGCLVGLTPAEWYAAINARVFFWLDPARLDRQRAACEPRPQVVLTLDTAGLLGACGQRASVTPINTGNARRRPARRGLASFVPWEEWARSGWRSEAEALRLRERPRSARPVEVAVLGAIPDVARFVVAVAELRPGDRFAG